MERISERSRKKATLVAGALAFSAILSGCGQTTPPSPEDINENIQFFEVDGPTAANGEPLRCVMYGDQSEVTNNSKSWFGFDCDFEGTASFPGESPQETTTTIGKDSSQ